ncbi:MAG: hypothetical protein ACRD4E_18645 [Bryobacteraceae bacterium]
MAEQVFIEQETFSPATPSRFLINASWNRLGVGAARLTAVEADHPPQKTAA